MTDTRGVGIMLPTEKGVFVMAKSTRDSKEFKLEAAHQLLKAGD